MLGSGRYDTRLGFQRRLDLSVINDPNKVGNIWNDPNVWNLPNVWSMVGDGYGNFQGEWRDYWVCWGVHTRKFGKESTEAGQLESTSMGVIVVRRCRRAMLVHEGDRITFKNGPYIGRSVQIRSRIMSADASEVEFRIEDGVAT